jgi:methylglyoxal synthase
VKEEIMRIQKTVAMIAHDARKDDLVQLAKAHRTELSEVELVATRGTGQLLKERTGLPVTLLQSGPRGGDQQIGALVANGEVNAVIFLRDPLTAHSYEPDVSALLRVCDVCNVPIATNLITAEAVLHLINEHPEALNGNHLVAQFIEEAVVKHD